MHPANALEFMFFGVPSKVSETKLEQFLNAPLPILVIPFGRLVKAKLEQPKNAPLPILVIPFGRLVKAKLEQFENA